MAPLSPEASSDSLSTEGLALDFNQFTTAIPGLCQQSGGKLQEILNREISHQNVINNSSFVVREQLFLSLNKTKKYFE